MKLTLVLSSAPMPCTIISTTILAAATASNTSAAIPGLSGTLLNVISDCVSSSCTPCMVRSSIDCSRLTTATASASLAFLAALSESSKVARSSGARPSSNSACTARKAANPCSRDTKQETLISLVVIASMLISASANARNIRSATPDWVAMPSPTTETFETLASCETLPAPTASAASFTASKARLSSLSSTVKEISALPSMPAVCMIISTATFTLASFSKIVRLTPGLSGTPVTVIRASSLVKAQPLTARLADSVMGPIIEPGSSVKTPLLRTWIGTLNFLPNSIDRLCITPAPRLASSNISSWLTFDILRASATIRGSVVNTPSTSV